MDIFSYTLGKKAGGGGSDIDWSQIGYSSEPKALSDIPQEAFVEAKKLYDYIEASGGTATLKNYMSIIEIDKANFYVCPPINMNKVSNLQEAFNACSSLVYVPKLNTTGSTLQSAFQGCKALEYVDMSSMLQSNITSMNGTFQDAGIKNINFNGTDASNVTNLNSAFTRCNRVLTLDLSQLDTSNVTSMMSTFSYCTNLTTLILNGKFNTKKVTNIGYCFQYSDKLTHITFGDNFTLEACSGSSSLNGMFSNCGALDDETLNAIMGVLLTATSYTGTKKLSTIGFTNVQATKAQTLSNWSELSSAGWTTGY